MAEITWLGHSSFRLRGKDATIVTDPYDKSVGLEPPKGQRADIVTVSREVPGHNSTQNVKGEFRVLRGPGEYEVKGVFITGIGTYADGKKGAERGKNTVFMYELDDLYICHLGGLGHVLTAEQIEALSDVHVLLVPIGGPHGLEGSKVAEVIAQIEPRLVVPMHLQSGDPTADGEILAKFLKDMGVAEYKPQEKLAVKASDLPETTQVVVLELKN